MQVTAAGRCTASASTLAKQALVRLVDVSGHRFSRRDRSLCAA